MSELTGEAGRVRERWTGWSGVAAVAVAAAMLAGCSGLVSRSGGPTKAVFNAGSGVGTAIDSREHARIIAAYGGVYHNDQVERALVPIVSRVVAASDRPEQAYQITILNAPAVNAFALPGGFLYVTRGLLALANDSSEVAAVLAHEMAHVTADHAIERQNKARNALIVSRVVNDVLDGEASGQLALASSRRSLATFSRQQELEADVIGVRTIGRAGYDPFASTRFLSAMNAFAEYRSALTGRDQRPDFLSSHPTTPQRIAFAEQAARQFGAPGIGERDGKRYQQGIEAMVFGDDPSQGFVRDRSYLHPELGIGFTVPVGFVIDNASEAVLATGVDGTALRFDAVGLGARADLAGYLRSGWVNGLDESSIRVFSVNGLKAASARAEAKGWSCDIAVIKVEGGATYRFIFANDAFTPQFQAAARATVDSFKILTKREVKALNVLQVKLVTAKPGDTISGLAEKMRGVDRPQQLFMVLNRLNRETVIHAGATFKIITDR